MNLKKVINTNRKSFLLFLFMGFTALALAGDPRITNLVMVPATPNFGDTVTVDFDVCIQEYQNNAKVAIAISSFNTLVTANTTGQTFVVYSNGAPVVGTPSITPRPVGNDFGYTLPAGPQWADVKDCMSCGSAANNGWTRHLSFTFKIPDAGWYPGCGLTQLYLHVATDENTLNSDGWTGAVAGCSKSTMGWIIGTPPKSFSIHKRVEGVLADDGDLALYAIDYEYGNGRLVINDPLPAGGVFEIVSMGPSSIISGAAVGATSGTITWTLPDKTGQPGSTNGTVWFLVRLKKPPAVTGQVITNTATGSMAGGPPNQSSSAALTVGSVTMNVIKSTDATIVRVGDTITYFVDYEVRGSKLQTYQAFDNLVTGATYSGTNPPPQWKFMPTDTNPLTSANTGIWTVMDPCGTGDRYIKADPVSPAKYPGMLVNTGDVTKDRFCTGEIVADTKIEGAYVGADSQIIIRHNGLTGTGMGNSVALIMSVDNAPGYLAFQTLLNGNPSWPAAPANLQTNIPGIAGDKWFRIRINVTQVGNDYVYRARAWARGDPEPGTWMVTYTQTNGATDNAWRCDGAGTYNDWRPGVNEQGGDVATYDSFDNFIVYKPFTSGNTVVYDTVPAEVTYTNASTAPNGANGAVRFWNLGNVSDTSASLTWWGVVNSCGSGVITNIAAMDGDNPVVPVYSNEVLVTAQCGTPTFTVTSTPTYTMTFTRTNTPSPTSTFTMTNTYTYTFTRTVTLTPTPTYTVTPTVTETTPFSPTATPTFTPTFTASPTYTMTYTSTDTRTATPSFTATSTFTESNTPTPTYTATPTVTQTSIFTATVTPTFTPTFTASPTFTVTNSSTDTRTATPTSTQTNTSTATPTYTETRTPSFTPTYTPTYTATSTYTVTFTRTCTPTITPTLPPFPYTLRIGVYNEAGELVRTIINSYASVLISEPQLLVNGSPTPVIGGGSALEIYMPGLNTPMNSGAASTSVYWLTDTDGAQVIGNGVYYIQFEQTDTYGHTNVIIKNVSVLKLEEYIEINIFNSAGEVVRTIKALNTSTDNVALNLDDVLLLDKIGSGVDIEYAAGQTIAWDGKNNHGIAVTTGTYEIQVISKTPLGRKIVASKTVMILAEAKEEVLGDFKILPNPYRGFDIDGVDHVRFQWNTTGTGLATVKIYNLAGELVAKMSDRLEKGYIDWSVYLTNGERAAAGIYLAVIETQSSDGRLERKKQKMGIMLQYNSNSGNVY